MPLGVVAQVARTAADIGAVVIIDEAAATYLGPDASTARLVPATENLVVLRGFTKAYSLGGMRAAFAVASSAIASLVRDAIAPLQVSEASLKIALALLSARDAFRQLVERIRVVKPEVIAALRAANFATVDGHCDLPWIALRDSGGESSRRLEALGIRPLLPTTARAFPDIFLEQPTIRVSLPLSETRMQRFTELLKLHDAQLATR
jgi:histidinol-phosphate/aromatic aminotransferase/cobyric acid decarboxylase-like protein